MRFTFTLSSIPLVALLALAGCPGVNSAPCSTDADCPNGRCRHGACGPRCVADTECGTEQVCVEGTCAARPECAADEDCALGFVCQNGRCACTEDAACAANQACVDGACVTRPRCRGDDDCTGTGRRCELVQGLCVPPCTLSSDCAPGLEPAVAIALYQCFQGTCHRRCLNDLSCGAPDLLCKDGLCAVADCATLADCPSGQYCTSATFGRCLEHQVCTATSQCPKNHACAQFGPASCPPGFDCAQSICQELPRCLIDSDCAPVPGSQAPPGFCADAHCQPSKACSLSSHCAPGQLCVAAVCVPGTCRGVTDCPSGQACTDGACAGAPLPTDINLLALAPRSAILEVGDTAPFTLVAFRLDGSSYPLASATFEIVDPQGQPSAAATVDTSGRVTALAPGQVLVRASVNGAFVPAKEAPITIYPVVSAGRRVLIIDAATGAPLAGVKVQGCEAPLAGGVCSAPVEVLTDATGAALFPTFSGATATFSAVSSEVRADGHPRYDRVSVVATAARDVFLPFTENPVHGAAGFNASISFANVRSTGQYWAGYAALSASDPAAVDLRTWLGDTFQVELPGVSQTFPVPGSVVLFTSPGFSIPQEIKGRSLGLGQAGVRAATAFAGRTDLSGALALRSAELFAYTGAMAFALQPPLTITHRPYVADFADVDNDGLCAQSAKCPQGTEDVPDYAGFTQIAFTPEREQAVRTEVVVPDLPGTLDSVVVSVVQVQPQTGVLPLGFSSRLAGPVGTGGTRPVEPVLMRSGAPYGGLELGQTGIWALAFGASNPGGLTARLTRSAVLPTRALLPPFLPLPRDASYTPSTRTLSPGQPAWSSVYSSGADLARAVLTGTEGRHVVYFALAANQASIEVPVGPTVPGVDPATQTAAKLQLTALDLSSVVTAEEIFTLGGANLWGLQLHLDGYSRVEP